jgi:hypothetical protein
MTIIDELELMRHSDRVRNAAWDAVTEANRQVDKWGVQHHPDGTGKGHGQDTINDLTRFRSSWESFADAARQRCNHYADLGEVEWEHILTEEFFEALEEEDPAELRTELIQVAAVALSWVADIDSRKATS